MTFRLQPPPTSSDLDNKTQKKLSIGIYRQACEYVLSEKGHSILPRSWIKLHSVIHDYTKRPTSLIIMRKASILTGPGRRLDQKTVSNIFKRWLYGNSFYGSETDDFITMPILLIKSPRKSSQQISWQRSGRKALIHRAQCFRPTIIHCSKANSK